MCTIDTLKPSYLISQWNLKDAGNGGGKRASQLKFSRTAKYQDVRNVFLPTSSLEFYTQMLKTNNMKIF